jgi:predicted DNA-binding protein
MATRLVKTKHWNPITISVSDELLDKLDYLPHDVPRSKYIQKIIEEHLRFMELS